MTQSPTMGTTGRSQGQDEDWTCSVCGCEIMVKHAGDPARMAPGSAYTCRCGTRMELEHPERGTTSAGASGA
jgi:hypothetical protein